MAEERTPGTDFGWTGGVEVCNVQGSATRWAPGLVKFAPALAYHFCLAMPATFMKPGAHLFAEPCNGSIQTGQLNADFLLVCLCVRPTATAQPQTDASADADDGATDDDWKKMSGFFGFTLAQKEV